MKINKQSIEKEFEGICKTNERLVKEYGDKLAPILFIVTNDERPNEIMAMSFKDYDDKQKVKAMIKYKLIHTENLEGYIIVIPTKMTIIDKANPNKYKTRDVIIRTLYTSKYKRMNLLTHKGLKIIRTEEHLIENRKNDKDDFDIWGTSPSQEDDKGMFEHYSNLKKMNPKDFEGVV